MIRRMRLREVKRVAQSHTATGVRLKLGLAPKPESFLPVFRALSAKVPAAVLGRTRNRFWPQVPQLKLNTVILSAIK